MKFTYRDYQKMLNAIRDITDFKPTIGAVLGSGLGGFADKIDVVARIPYEMIPGLPVSTNKAHKGQFVFGYFENTPIVLMQGRLHCYEGYTSEEVVTPIRLMCMMGIKKLILTNAAGSVNIENKPGDIMVITDQIASFVKSPLIGENIEEFGTRFPDMSDIYNKELSDKIYSEAKKVGLPIKRGVYMQFSGPQYESKAEVRMASLLGADACGMSTAIEAIASNHMGVKTVGLSLLTNMACGILDQKLSDDEVIEIATKAEKDITSVFELTIRLLKEEDE